MTVLQDVGMKIKMNTPCFGEIHSLSLGERIDESSILSLCEYVNDRHDCADFRLIVLVNSYLAYRHLLSEETISQMERTMISFKYWMDEPGHDGMCYWSENHQLLFSVCEYFAGELFPDTLFTNNQELGRVHASKAKKRIVNWLKHRFTYGFTEWHSNTYYEEDIAPLCVLIDHCQEEWIVQSALMVTDLLLLDMAHHLFDSRFVGSSGRCYELQKKDSSKADVNDILAHAFGIDHHDYDYTRLSALFVLCKGYVVPEVIKQIASSKESMIFTESTGLDLSEVKKEFPAMDKDEYGMFLWAMEAFTNVESIHMTMTLFRDWNLQHNTFLKDLSMLNHPILHKLRVYPLLVKLLNPATQGVAIQRANVYTYKTPDFCLSTAQRYHPGEFGDQQHLYQCTLPNHINIFSTHPGSPMFDDSARNFSPSYFVGNGINPDVVQHQNVVLICHNSAQRKGFLERKRLHLYHFYVPKNHFDEVVIQTKAFYGRVKNSYLAILSTSDHIHLEDEIIIHGKKSGHVVVVSSSVIDHSFEEFVNKYPISSVKYRHNQLEFHGDDDLVLQYRSRFLVNGVNTSTQYDRFDTPFVKEKRKPSSITIQCCDYKLHLDIMNQIRNQFMKENPNAIKSME